MYAFYILLCYILIILFRQGVCELSENDRADSFHGYTEKSMKCQDKQSNCQDWATAAECLRNPYFMRAECQQACQLSYCAAAKEIVWSGYATEYDTKKYSSKMPISDLWSSRHFRVDVAMGEYIEPGHRLRGMPWLTLSSIGVGTYLGNQDNETDAQVAAGIILAVTNGVNVIDTASNYRFGHAERSVGDALYSVFSDRTKYGFKREMLFLSTKVGFIADDIKKQLIHEGSIIERDVVGGVNCIHPRCIRASLERSLSSLRVKTVDLLYLHNAAEVQIPKLGKQKFLEELKRAFVTLEELRTQGKIRAYGMATWTCFRVSPETDGYLSLQQVIDLAKQVGGINHGFRYIQLPINIGMPEAWREKWQVTSNQTYSSLLWVAAMNNVGVFVSGPLGEGSLINNKEANDMISGVFQLKNVKGTGAKLLQLVRSTPGIVSALVGMKNQDHVRENLALSLIDPIDVEDMTMLYSEFYGTS